MKRHFFLISWFLALVQPVLTQEISPEITNAEEREILGIAVKLTRPSLAYRTVAGEKLLSEANFFSEQLKLPVQRPIQAADANIRVIAPWFSKQDSTNRSLPKVDRIRAASFFASGVIESGNFTFSFGGPENRRYVHRVRIKTEDSILDLYPELAATPSLIDTNGAYQLATQWLNAVSVNVPELQSQNKLHFYQWFFWGKPEDLPKDQWTFNAPTSTNKTMLPIYDVKWGEGTTPPVQVTVLGTTKELLELRIENGRFLNRVPLIVSNALELNTRPDPPVKRLERPIEEPQTNSISYTNSALQRPPPFRQQIKPKQ